jgi:hypothetical protein
MEEYGHKGDLSMKSLTVRMVDCDLKFLAHRAAGTPPRHVAEHFGVAVAATAMP